MAGNRAPRHPTVPSVTVRFIDCTHEFQLPPPEWNAIGQMILGFLEDCRASRCASTKPII
jgi:hypothetical protein